MKYLFKLFYIRKLEMILSLTDSDFFAKSKNFIIINIFGFLSNNYDNTIKKKH